MEIENPCRHTLGWTKQCAGEEVSLQGDAIVGGLSGPLIRTIPNSLVQGTVGKLDLSKKLSLLEASEPNHVRIMASRSLELEVTIYGH